MTPQVSTLPNGLTVLSLAMPATVSASVGLFVDVGARHESAERNGLAHFLEHMVFKGTRSRSARAIAEAIEDVGGQLNAWTARDTTAFHARVLAADLPLAVELLADLLLDSRFDAEDIEREREVVLSELAEARDTPDDLVWDLCQGLAFPEQPLGRPILGTEQTLESMDQSALQGWLDDHYRGDSAVLAAAGAVDHARVVALAERFFGTLGVGRARPHAPARWSGGTLHDRRKVEATQMVLGFEGPGLHDPGYFATQLFATALGGGMSSRLFQELREERGLAYSVSASHLGYHETGVFAVSLATQPKQAHGALALAREVLRAGAEGLTQEELQRAKAQLKASMLMAMEDAGGLMSWMGQRWLTHRRFLDVPELVRSIDAVQLEAVRTAGAALLAGTPAQASIGPKAP